MPRHWLCLAALLSGCAASQNFVFYQYNEVEGVKSKSLDRIKWENAVQPGEDLSKTLILQMDNSSTHLIQIRGSEKKHVHEFHDSTVIIQSGSGRMYLGRSSFKAHPGSIIFIPHGVEHYYVNGGSEPTSAIAVFSPAYDGKDIVFRE